MNPVSFAEALPTASVDAPGMQPDAPRDDVADRGAGFAIASPAAAPVTPPAHLQPPAAPGRPARARRRFDRFTDRLVDMAGSAPALSAAALFELAWLVAGRPARFSNGWQLVMSDVSTVVVFWMNPVLQNAENRHKAAMLERFGRSAEIARLLAERLQQSPVAWQPVPEPPAPQAGKCPGRFDRTVDAIGGAVGSPAGFALALAGVGAWAGLGPVLHWSDTWQLIINSATSAFELPAAMKLHNTKIRRDTLLGAAVGEDIYRGEHLLRHAGHTNFPVAPPIAPPDARSRLQRALDGVAKMEGSAPPLWQCRWGSHLAGLPWDPRCTGATTGSWCWERRPPFPLVFFCWC